MESALFDLYSLTQVFEVTLGRDVKDHIFHSLYLTDMEAEAQRHLPMCLSEAMAGYFQNWSANN